MTELTESPAAVGHDPGLVQDIGGDDMRSTAVHVVQPDTSRKVDAIKRAISLKRFQLERLAASSPDAEIIRADLEALEAVVVDYQPDQRRIPHDPVVAIPR